MLPREVEQDPGLGEFEERFVDAGRESQVYERIPREAVAQDHAAEKPFRDSDFPEVSKEIVECDCPRVQVQEDGMPA